MGQEDNRQHDWKEWMSNSHQGIILDESNKLAPSSWEVETSFSKTHFMEEII